ncbi:hypothetical protein MKZ38_003091 [Zalerion maritima]|uniref:Dynactin subunit n=1 Tax=Zalerion maritima TaxID=339359 RepID=A0AAD5S4U3_9PEZI|nr:hypothetical protein MKZ38_003091 [Zalerion maritima]
MALNRKYAALPDLDSAPDIYETPELTDDISTVPVNCPQTTTVQSHSDRDFDDEDDTPNISRSRLRINDARCKFEPAKIDARDVDFSDRLDGKRKSYKVSSRRRRVLKDGTEELGDLSDEDDENLDRKVARLKRELEEVKDEVGKRARAAEEPEDEDLDKLDELATLSSALDEISLPIADRRPHRAAHIPEAPKPEESDSDSEDEGGDVDASGNVTYAITYAPTYQQRHALMKAADFDQRLLELEKAIGIGSSALPELESNGLPRAIIPTLDTLQKQIGTLSEASVSSLDSIARRARTLTQEADILTKARKSAKEAKEALGGDSEVTKDDPTSESSEQATKINALYGTLPTIENLKPLLPPLLDRLRSLRAIHSEAASAGQTLDKLESKQAEMAEDIKQWKEGLEKVESAMVEGEETMQTNKKVIGGWVKGLEERMDDLE